MTRRAFSRPGRRRSRGRQEVALVEQHDVGGLEHVGVFEGFVLALGDREDGHLVVFPQVEGGGADQVADVFDEKQRFLGRPQPFQRVADHVGVEVAALPVLICRPARRWRGCARRR